MILEDWPQPGTSMLKCNLKYPQTVKQVVKKKDGSALSGVVLEPRLEERLRDVAIATKNTKLNGGMYRNLLFHGPPGNN